jgi:hypothetical protein
MDNILSYLTLREMLIWQHGTDLVSYELALRAAGNDKRGLRGPSRTGTASLAEVVDAELKLPSEADTEAALADDGDIAKQYDPPALLEYVESRPTDGTTESLTPGVSARLRDLDEQRLRDFEELRGEDSPE